MAAATVLKLTSVKDALGLPLRSNSPVSIRLSQNDLYQYRIVQSAKHSSLYATCIKAHISFMSTQSNIEVDSHTLLPTNVDFLAIFRNEITTILTPSTSEGGGWGWSCFSFWRSLITNPQC